jgi:hypothetical protein
VPLRSRSHTSSSVCSALALALAVVAAVVAVAVGGERGVQSERGGEDRHSDHTSSMSSASEVAGRSKHRISPEHAASARVCECV